MLRPSLLGSPDDLQGEPVTETTKDTCHYVSIVVALSDLGRWSSTQDVDSMLRSYGVALPFEEVRQSLRKLAGTGRISRKSVSGEGLVLWAYKEDILLNSRAYMICMEEVEQAGAGLGYSFGLFLQLMESSRRSTFRDVFAAQAVWVLHRMVERIRYELYDRLTTRQVEAIRALCLRDESSLSGTLSASLERLLRVQQGVYPSNVPPMRYLASEAKIWISSAVRTGDPLLLPWAFLPTDEAQQKAVVFLFTMLHGLPCWSLEFLVRCSVHLHVLHKTNACDSANDLWVSRERFQKIADSVKSQGLPPSESAGGEEFAEAIHRMNELQAGTFKGVIPKRDTLEVVCLVRAMHQTQGNTKLAARLMGIGRNQILEMKQRYALGLLTSGVYSKLSRL